jgi:hypothetical protein
MVREPGAVANQAVLVPAADRLVAGSSAYDQVLLIRALDR